MAVTIRKIAEAAGVSRGTVDKVLNNRYGVSADVREKVKKVAEELGYKPNLAGKALAYQKNRIKIGVIILDKHDHVFQEVYKGAKQAYSEFKDFGITVDFCIMNTDSVDEQLQYIEILSKNDISALVISPLDNDSVIDELKKLSEKNIPIITINTDIEGIEKLCFIGQDSKRSGRVAGHIIGELFPDGGEVAILSGERKYKTLEERIDGFREIIRDEYPDIHILEIASDIKNNADAYIKTNKIFNQHSGLKALFITTTKPMEGIMKSIREESKKHLKYVCYDMRPEMPHMMLDNTIDFTITQEPFMQGYLPIKTLFEYFFQNKLPKPKIYTKLEIRTKENISE